MEPQVLVVCCLIHISIIIMRHVLCLLVYVSPCLDVGLFMLYLFYLLFFFTFIIINHIISLKQTNRHTYFFAYFCLNFTQFFCQFQRGHAYKSVAYTKKAYAAYLNTSKHRKSWFVNFLLVTLLFTAVF